MTMVDFGKIQQDACMPAACIKVMDELRDHVHDLYARMFQRCERLPDGLPNLILPALTLVWIESVYNVFGSASYESAITMLRVLEPEDAETRKGMRQAVNDLMRRSRWAKRRKST
jgi:hypothetical protein